GGFWISRDAKGRVLTVDFRETAPRLARRDLFLAGPGRAAPSSTAGALASGVPGSVAGLALAHRRAGKLPWKVVVEPAVELARDGFPMDDNIAASVARDRARRVPDDRKHRRADRGRSRAAREGSGHRAHLSSQRRGARRRRGLPSAGP